MTVTTLPFTGEFRRERARQLAENWGAWAEPQRTILAAVLAHPSLTVAEARDGWQEWADALQLYAALLDGSADPDDIDPRMTIPRWKRRDEALEMARRRARSAQEWILNGRDGGHP